MSITNKLSHIAYELRDANPYALVERRWEDKVHNKWTLKIRDGNVHCSRKTPLDDNPCATAVSRVSKATLTKMIPGIEQEVASIKNYMENILRLECYDEINKMVSDAITDGKPCETDTHVIFVGIMRQRVEAMGKALAELPVPPELAAFTLTKRFDKDDLASLRVPLAFNVTGTEIIQRYSINVANYYEALAYHAYWPEIAEFYAKVFYNLGKICSQQSAKEVKEGMTQWSRRHNRKTIDTRIRHNEILIDQMYNEFLRSELTKGDFKYKENPKNSFDDFIFIRRQEVYDAKLKELSRYIPFDKISVHVNCPGGLSTFDLVRYDSSIDVKNYIEGFEEYNRMFEVLIKFLELMKEDPKEKPLVPEGESANEKR